MAQVEDWQQSPVVVTSTADPDMGVLEDVLEPDVFQQVKPLVQEVKGGRKFILHGDGTVWDAGTALLHTYANQSKSHQDNAASALRIWLDHAEWAGRDPDIFTLDEVLQFRRDRIEEHMIEASTWNQSVKFYKALAEQSVQLGLMTQRPWSKNSQVTLDEGVTPLRYVTVEDFLFFFQRGLQALDANGRPVADAPRCVERNAVLGKLLFYTGIRLTEVTHLTLLDLPPARSYEDDDGLARWEIPNVICKYRHGGAWNVSSDLRATIRRYHRPGGEWIELVKNRQDDLATQHDGGDLLVVTGFKRDGKRVKVTYYTDPNKTGSDGQVKTKQKWLDEIEKDDRKRMVATPEVFFSFEQGHEMENALAAMTGVVDRYDTSIGLFPLQVLPSWVGTPGLSERTISGDLNQASERAVAAAEAEGRVGFPTITAHMIRHTFAIEWLRDQVKARRAEMEKAGKKWDPRSPAVEYATANPRLQLQLLLRHEDGSTTLKYLKALTEQDVLAGTHHESLTDVILEGSDGA